MICGVGARSDDGGGLLCCLGPFSYLVTELYLFVETMNRLVQTLARNCSSLKFWIEFDWYQGV